MTQERRPQQRMMNQGIRDLLAFMARPHMAEVMFWIGQGDGQGGPLRHKEIMAFSGVPRNTLAKRLRELVEAGLMERTEHPDAHPPRVEYAPTPKMYDLALVFRAMATWTNDHDLVDLGAAATWEASEEQE
ncbi:MAG: winged helix-turn-helix transcriptional regulator [Thermoplasmatota archaeon]